MASTTSSRVANHAGFSLHAGVMAEVHQRDKLERLCRYVSRPAVSEKRLPLTSNGQVRYELKTPYRNGTKPPKKVVCDNGTEFTSKAMFFWSKETGITLGFIQPGKPTQNAFVESLNGKFRKECLSANWFRSLDEARVEINQWREHYNHVRPHSSLNYLPPVVTKSGRLVNRKLTPKAAARLRVWLTLLVSYNYFSATNIVMETSF